MITFESKKKTAMNRPSAFARAAFLGVFLWSVTACQDERTPAPDNNPPVDSTTFLNPLLNSGPDPWVTQQGDTYYYMHTMGNRITLRAATQLMYLQHAWAEIVWTPPLGTGYSNNIWAPELHYLQDKWYIYFAADNGQDVNHRMYVMERSSEDPLEGT